MYFAFCFLCGVTLAVPGHSTIHNVRKYGAHGDGKRYDTLAVRDAAAAIAQAGDGILLFPPGVYLIGAFNVSSNTHVEIVKGATLLGSTRGSDWPLLVAAQVWPQMGHGSDCAPGTEACRLMHQALLFSLDAINVTVTGGGTLDCNSQEQTWWRCAHDLSQPPCSGYSRPHCLMMSNVSAVEVSHVQVRNSPDWTLHFSSSRNVWVHHVHVTNPVAPNTDGIDIDASQNVLVENSYFTVGDDALCVKSGIDCWGRKYGHPAKNVTFRNNVIGMGHGITVGSETSGGVEDVLFENITLNRTGTGIRMKSMRGRGGVVKNIVYRNIQMFEIDGQCVQMTLDYLPASQTNRTATPVFDNVLLQNVFCAKANSSFFLDGLPESNLRNITFHNVSMGTAVGAESLCKYIDCYCTATASCPSCCRTSDVGPLRSLDRTLHSKRVADS